MNDRTAKVENVEAGASYTMTVAGVCGLYIAQMGLDDSPQQLDPATGVAARCGKYPEDDAIARGLAFVADRFVLTDRKEGDRSRLAGRAFYSVYGIERLGRLSGRRFVGPFDWYREGCRELVALQDATTGAITGPSGLDATPVSGHVVRAPVPEQGPHPGTGQQVRLGRPAGRRAGGR